MIAINDTIEYRSRAWVVRSLGTGSRQGWLLCSLVGGPDAKAHYWLAASDCVIA